MTNSAYTGDGVTTQFDITFSYRLAPTIHASIDGVETTAFTFVNASRIEFNTPPPSGAEIKIFRVTPVTPAEVQFEDGAIITEADLNTANAQALDAVEETASNLTELSNSALQAPAGETLPTLPSAAERRSKVLTFDLNGLPLTLPIGEAAAVLQAQSREFTATEGQDEFAFESDALGGFVSVYVNGSRLAASDFSHTDATVTLTTPATAGDIVVIEGFIRSTANTDDGLRDDLAATTGAALVGVTSGGTLQTKLDAMDASIAAADSTLRSDLSAATGATLVNVTGGGTLQAKLDAMDADIAATDGTLRSDLAEATGATLVNVTGGGTLQAKLDAMDTEIANSDNTLRSDLSSATGATLVNVTGGGTLQAKLDALDTADSGKVASSNLSAATGGTLVGVTGGGTLQDKLDALDTADGNRPTSATLAGTGGAGLIGTSDSSTVQAKLDELAGGGGGGGIPVLNFLDYVPAGEHAAIAARTSTLDLTSYLNTAFSDLAAAGGGKLYIPEGLYNINAQPNMVPINTTILGANKRSTEIRTNLAGTNVRDGSIFWREEAINGSTAVNIAIRDLKLKNTATTPWGAGLYDGCGTFLEWHNVEVEGFRFGAVWDQTELAEIDRCHFHAQKNTGGGLWIVNGPDIRAGVSGGFTNRLSITRNQFNHSGGIMAIIDDGGISHYYNANNINGGPSRFAGVEPLYVGNGEWESVVDDATITMHNSTYYGGTGAGACIATFESNIIAAAGGYQGIKCVSGNRIILTGNQFAVPPGPSAAITGTANVYHFINKGSYSTYTSVPLFEGPGTVHEDDQLLGVKGLGGATSIAMNMTHMFKRNMGEAGSAITITVPDNATTPIPIGAWTEFQQNAGGQITFAPENGSVGIFSEGAKLKTNTTHSVVKLYKFATNSWNLSGDRVA